MKALIICLTLLTLILLTIIFVGVSELRKERQVDQSTIDGMKIRIIMEKRAYLKVLDSIRTDFSRRMDSVTFAHGESLEANVVSQREIRTLKGILFITHTDSSRNVELKNLYPTFNP